MNAFTYTEEVMDNQSKFFEVIKNHQLKYLPCATVDSKDGVVLEVNCFPAAADFYNKEFVPDTFEAAAKIAGVLQSAPLDVILVTEDFNRHPAYTKNIWAWDSGLSSMDTVRTVKRVAFNEQIESGDLIISNSDLRFEQAALQIIKSGIPCFPSPYAGWWKRSKIGTCLQIDEVCSNLGLDSKWVQPDYRFVKYDQYAAGVLAEIKEKTLELLALYPCGIIAKHAAGTQGYGCEHIFAVDDYDQKDVRDSLALKRGFRGSKIHGLLLQRCMPSLKFQLQYFNPESRLVTEEERLAELYFVMTANSSLQPSISDTFLRIGPTKQNHNLNRPGEVFKNLKPHDFASLGITSDDYLAACLTAQLAYVATDIQVERLKKEEECASL